MLQNAADRVAAAGMGFFELRLPDFGPTDEGEKAEAKARQAACKGATADVEGVAIVAEVLEEARAQKERLGMLTGGAVGSRELPGGLVPLVLLSAAQVRGPACAHTWHASARSYSHSTHFPTQVLGYDEAPDGELRENEFGFRKRSGEAALRKSSIEWSVVRSAAPWNRDSTAAREDAPPSRVSRPAALPSI